VRIIDYGHWITGGKVRIIDYGHWITEGKVRITDFCHWITGKKYGLRIFSFGSQDGLLSTDDR